MNKTSVEQNVKVAQLNNEEIIEMANYFENIIESSIELCRRIFPNSHPEVIILEDDVYKSYLSLESRDQYKLINELLRAYFSKQ